MRRKLYLSRYDRKLAGVCGGIAEYFEIDATLVRLLYVFLSFATVGTGIVLYIVAAMIMTEAPSYDYDHGPGSKEEENFGEYHSEGSDGEGYGDYQQGAPHQSYGESNTFGIILIIAGAIFLLSNFFSWNWFSFRYIWPLGLIVIGASIVYNGRKW